MTAFPEMVLLGDIGATNARFGLLTNGVLGPIKWIEVAGYPQFADAIEDILSAHFHQRPVTHALFAVAGPVQAERCSFTNCPWTIDGSQIKEQFEFQSVRLINDFEATALSLPFLTEQDVCSLGSGRAVPG